MQNQSTFPAGTDFETFATLVKQVAESLKWKFKKQEGQTLVFSTSMNLLTVGENITVEYLSEELAQIQTKLKIPAAADWGRGAGHISKFIRGYQEGLKEVKS
jgi:hypothetical protein